VGFHVVPQLTQKTLPIVVMEEDRGTAVSAGGHVVHGIREIDPGQSWHVRSVAEPPAAAKCKM